MENIGYRIQNCFTLANGTTCTVGAGMAMIGVFAPIALPNISQETALFFLYVGFGLVGIGLALAVWRYIKNPIEKKLRIYSIITVLDKMYKRLEVITGKEKRKEIDCNRFSETASKINRFAGVTVPVVSSVDDARREIETLEKELPNTLSVGEKREQKIRWIHSVSRLLDKGGFGLKEKRKEDSRYTRLLRMVDEYYDVHKDVMDDEWRILIRSHTDFAESAANALLFVLRMDSMLSSAGVPNLLTPSLEADAEGFGEEIREIARGIRVEIGQHIKKVVNPNGKSKTTKIQ